MLNKLDFEYTPYKVEAGKIKEFARSIGLTNRIYFEKAVALQKGYRDIPAPPTFTTVIDFWNDRDYYSIFEILNLEPANVLHGEQSFEYMCSICAGDTISGRVQIKDRLQKKGKTFYFLETIYKNQYHETVVVNRATLIEINEVSD